MKILDKNSHIYLDAGSMVSEESIFSLGKREKALSFCVILLYVATTAFLGYGRSYFSTVGENDFVGIYAQEAERLISGKPLELPFQPPFYLMPLAALELLCRDWLRSGLLLSWLSLMPVLILGFKLFYKIGGRPAAWGALIGLISSAKFLQFSTVASTDLLFLALILSTLYVGFHAISDGSRWLWALSGFLLGLVFLTRSNGVAFLVLLVLPWLEGSPCRSRSSNFYMMCAFFLLPLLMWWVVAHITGSPFLPVYNFVNLALNYYPHESFDQVYEKVVSEKKFHGMLDVITYNPIVIAVNVIKNFFVRLPEFFFKNGVVLSFPFNMLAFPGTFFLLKCSKKPFAFIYLLLIILNAAVLSLHPNPLQDRYFLFMTPFLGAGVGLFLQKMISHSQPQWQKYSLIIVISILFLSGIASSYRNVYNTLHNTDQESAEIIPKIRELAAQNGLLATCMQGIGLQSGMKTSWFPLADTMTDLKSGIEASASSKPVYILYGATEKKYRPRLSNLSSPENRPEWLDVVAQGQAAGGWVLYRFRGLPSSP